MAMDAFLKIDGIDGESTDDKHKNWIEILSYNHGITQASSIASGTTGRTGTRCSMTDFYISKEVDKSSPLLAQACSDGRSIKEVKIELCEAGGDKHTYMVYIMENVVISSFKPVGDKQNPKPLENLTFNFGTIKWEYTPMGHDGRPGSKVGPMGWSLENNVKL